MASPTNPAVPVRRSRGSTLPHDPARLRCVAPVKVAPLAHRRQPGLQGTQRSVAVPGYAIEVELADGRRIDLVLRAHHP